MNNKPFKKPTIKDIASMAGVSVASVSRFLNNKSRGRVSKEKATEIERAIKLLNYVPNAAARQLTTKKSKMIAVVVANIDDYFSTEIFKGASEIFKSRGYQAVLLDIGADQKQEAEILNSVYTQSFDGLLLQPLSSDLDKLESEIRSEKPLVILDRNLNTKKWTQVLTNNYEVSKKATKYFIDELQCDNVLVLSSQINIASTRKERYNAIKSTVSAKNLKTIEINESSYNPKKVLSIIEKYLLEQHTQNKKTLIFGLKERWLVEFIPKLIADGYISNDVHVTGFADTSVLHVLLPSAHLISQNPYLMGASAAEILLNKLNNKPSTFSDSKIFINSKF